MIRLLFLFVMIGSAASAQNSLNLALPSLPQSYQSDSFSAGELNCSNAIGSATNLEFGVTGIIEQADDPYNINSQTSSGRNVGVYARITIPLGARARQRVNCNALFELELQRRRLEVMRLEEEIRQLRELQFTE